MKEKLSKGIWNESPCFYIELSLIKCWKCNWMAKITFLFRGRIRAHREEKWDTSNFSVQVAVRIHLQHHWGCYHFPSTTAVSPVSDVQYFEKDIIAKSKIASLFTAKQNTTFVSAQHLCLQKLFFLIYLICFLAKWSITIIMGCCSHTRNVNQQIKELRGKEWVLCVWTELCLDFTGEARWLESCLSFVALSSQMYVLKLKRNSFGFPDSGCLVFHLCKGAVFQAHVFFMPIRASRASALLIQYSFPSQGEFLTHCFWLI